MKRTMTVVHLPQEAYKMATELAERREVNVVEAIEQALVDALDLQSTLEDGEANRLKSLAGE